MGNCATQLLAAASILDCNVAEHGVFVALAAAVVVAAAAVVVVKALLCTGAVIHGLVEVLVICVWNGVVIDVLTDTVISMLAGVMVGVRAGTLMLARGLSWRLL